MASPADAKSLPAQIKCVERELKMRRNVYGRRVAEKRMSQADADRELATMGAVLDTLKKLEADQLSFFDQQASQ